MPIPLRNFYYNRLIKNKEHEEREIEKSKGISEAKPTSIRR